MLKYGSIVPYPSLQIDPAAPECLHSSFTSPRALTKGVCAAVFGCADPLLPHTSAGLQVGAHLRQPLPHRSMIHRGSMKQAMILRGYEALKQQHQARKGGSKFKPTQWHQIIMAVPRQRENHVLKLIVAKQSIIFLSKEGIPSSPLLGHFQPHF